MRPTSVAYLLDHSPVAWDTRTEIHCRLCGALHDAGVRPVVVFSAEVPDVVRERFEAAGAVVLACSYAAGRAGYFKQIGKLVEKYDVGHVNVRFFDYFCAVPWLARLKGVRHIVFTEANPGEWKGDSWTAPLVRLRGHLACRPVSRFIAISKFIKRRLLNLGFADERIAVVYNGVDVERFQPNPAMREPLARELGFDPNDVLIAGVFALVPCKQVHVLLDASALLIKRGLPIRLLLAGDGPLRAELEARGRQLGIDSRIHWLGHFDRPAALFQSADISVLPTVGEAFGNVLAEAMACGLPIVGSRSGGIPEVVEDGQTGILATSGDALGFAAALERLASDAALRREMGQRGIERVHKNFTLEKTVEGTLAVYESLWRETK